MDPTQNTSPDESALPNVSSQPAAGGDPLNAPQADQVDTVAPIADMPMPAQPAAAPLAPPPVSQGNTGWLPPTVPVQPIGQSSDQSGSQGSNGQPMAAPAINVPAPAIADDGDVIEKEWVEKAKQIVERTRQDPYNQTRELHKFKAEYLQKRYNKTIEAVED